MARGGRGGGGSGTSAISGTSGNDILDGRGPSFLLAGGRGDDTYYVDDAGDVVDEKNNGGSDLIYSLIDLTLGDSVENLTLMGLDSLSGTGNASANILTGNDADNTLSGLGGDDTIIGNGGSDLIDGGDGTDTATFDGNSTEYEIRWEGSDLLVTSLTLGTTDVLRNIEILRFQDRLIMAADIGATPGEPLPQAVDDIGATSEDTGSAVAVLVNDLGEGISVASATNGAKGLVTVNADGTISYTPNANSFGSDSFTYTIRDAQGRESTATVTLEIAEVNDAPVALADSYTVGADATFTSATSVLANDTDIDGDPLFVVGAGAGSSIEIAPGAASYQFTTDFGGTVSVNSDGTFTYTPAAGFSGTDGFTYAVGDAQGASDIATVTLTVTASAPAPETPPYYVDALIVGGWNRLNYPEPFGTGATVTFAFAEATPDYYDPSSSVWNNFQTFTAEQRSVTRSVLDAIESFSGLTFVETAVEDAEMVFGIADVGSSGLAYWPVFDGTGNRASDVWLDDSRAVSDFEPGTTAYKTLIHEIGHAIGLTHPDLQGDEGTRKYSVMAGYLHPAMELEEPSTYMLYDIAAIQYLYGVNTSFALGSNVYEFGSFDGIIRTVWDGGGQDVFDLSAATYGVRIDLREGAFSTITATGSDNIAIAFGTVIEDAIGGAHDDVLIGNAADNRLTGGGGADVFGFGAGWGSDTITDFQRGEDGLDFSRAGMRFADLQITSVGGDTLISHGGNTVLIEGVTNIDASDFLTA